MLFEWREMKLLRKSNSTESAKWLIREAHDISKWIYLSFCKGKLEDIKPYEYPKVSNQES